MQNSRAAVLRESGNQAFKDLRLPEALKLYSEAIDLLAAEPLCDDLIFLFSNRSACCLRMNDAERALIDANAGLEAISQIAIAPNSQIAAIKPKVCPFSNLVP